MVLAGTEPPSVVIADDHVPTRAMVRSALEADGFEILAEAPDASGAIEAVRSETPRVALLDVRMPGNGIEAAAAISEVSPGTSIVMLTVSEDADDLFSALRAGAVGYLLKGAGPASIARGLRAILAGEAAIPRTLAMRLVAEFSRRNRRYLIGTRGARLTNREWDVLELLADGLSTAGIAERLFIAQVTVRSHVAAIVRKLQVTDRAAAARVVRGGRLPD
jgi:DNA-binding NarL/FixJ family response regulator